MESWAYLALESCLASNCRSTERQVSGGYLQVRNYLGAHGIQAGKEGEDVTGVMDSEIVAGQ